MQLVIDIPEEVYKASKNMALVVGRGYGKMLTPTIYGIYSAIATGTPLPENHGRIGDLDAVMNDICTSIDAMTNIGIVVDGEYLWAKLNDAIYDAPTIIEADKE